MPLFKYPDTWPPVLYVGRHSSSVGQAVGMLPHTHPAGLEVCYIERGEMEWWAGPRVYDLRPHDVLATLPHVPHGTVDSALSPSEYIWVHVDPRWLPDSLRHSVAGSGFEGLHRERSDVGAMLRAIYQEHLAPDELSAETCRSLAILVVAQLARAADKGDHSPISMLVADAQKALLDETTPQASVAEVADRLSVSSVWLTKKFRKEVGRPPATWLRSRRLAEAKRLLAMRSDSIGDIAFRLGYTSSQYFSTAFRRETGMTPSQYRVLHAESAGH